MGRVYVRSVERVERSAVSSTLAKGTPVVSLDTGSTLGKIEHVYLDCEARRLVAFSFTSGGGLLSAKRGHVVEVDDVHAVGPDAVTLDDARAVRDLVLMEDKVRRLVELDQVVKLDVMTDTGTSLGRIVGLDFDPETFRLIRLRVEVDGHDGDGVIDGAGIVSIGEEVIVVADPATAPRLAAVPTPMPRVQVHDLRDAG